jgi:hypothetical protein
LRDRALRTRPWHPILCLPLRAHVEQVHEEVVGQRFRTLGKDAALRLSEVGVQDAHATNENRHLGRGQRQQLRSIDQQLLGRYGVRAPEVVSEAIGGRFEDGDGVHIGLLRRGIHAFRCEGNRHGLTGILRRLLDVCATGQNDQVSERGLLAARLRAVSCISPSCPTGWSRRVIGDRM